MDTQLWPVNTPQSYERYAGLGLSHVLMDNAEAIQYALNQRKTFSAIAPELRKAIEISHFDDSQSKDVWRQNAFETLPQVIKDTYSQEQLQMFLGWMINFETRKEEKQP